MAALAGDLSKQILGHSESVKAFRPWWDNLEDQILYGFVLTGVVLLTMSFLGGTPVECTLHPKLWNDNYTSEIAMDDDDEPPDDEFSMYQNRNMSELSGYARFLRSYAKKYCTEIHLSPFLLYLPFIMMLIPMILVAIDKLFVKCSSSDEHLEVLYSSLVKTSLGREDVANLEKENVKNSHEVKQSFRNASKASKSYLYRTSLELLASVILMIFFLSYGDIKGLARPLFDCDVHSILFKCVIPNSRFYYAVYMIGFTLLLAYISLTGYNLLWLVHPKVGKLERILSGCRRRSKKSFDTCTAVLDVPKSPDGIPEIRLEMYYDKKGQDFSLLMQLLAEQSSGLAQAFRILCVFDKHFQRLWKPRDNKVIVQRPLINTFTLDPQDKESKSNIKDQIPKSVIVLWNDAEIFPYIRTKIKDILEYTVEISPPTEAPIKNFLYHDIPDFGGAYETKSLILPSSKKGSSSSFSSDFSNKIAFVTNYEASGDMTQEEFGLALASMYKYSCRFDGLEENTEYTVSISTEVDGKTISQITMQVAKSSSESCSSSPKRQKSEENS